MSEKSEWELVDAPQFSDKSSGFHYGSQDGASREKGPSSTHFLQALLGRWWQLKLLGAGIVAITAFTLLVMIGGVLILTVSLVALVSFGIARLVLLLRGKQPGHNAQLNPQNRRPWQQ